MNITIEIHPVDFFIEGGPDDLIPRKLVRVEHITLQGTRFIEFRETHYDENEFEIIPILQEEIIKSIEKGESTDIVYA